MKKLILSLVIVGVLFGSVPVVAKASTQEELTQQLITLLTQMIAQLQQQIADILASQASQIATIQQQTETINQQNQTIQQIQQSTQQIATNTTPPPVCVPDWQCGSWSSCANSNQTRICTDSNNCGVLTDKPTTTQSCTCTFNWSCTEWGACSDFQQTRTCTDLNNCIPSYSRPASYQYCVSIGSLTASVAIDTPIAQNTTIGQSVIVGKYNLKAENNSYSVQGIKFSISDDASKIVDSAQLTSTPDTYGGCIAAIPISGATASFNGLTCRTLADTTKSLYLRFNLSSDISKYFTDNIDVKPTLIYVRALDSQGEPVDTGIITGNLTANSTIVSK